jgi:hypothetical protein
VRPRTSSVPTSSRVVARHQLAIEVDAHLLRLVALAARGVPSRLPDELRLPLAFVAGVVPVEGLSVALDGLRVQIAFEGVAVPQGRLRTRHAPAPVQGFEYAGTGVLEVQLDARLPLRDLVEDDVPAVR